MYNDIISRIGFRPNATLPIIVVKAVCASSSKIWWRHARYKKSFCNSCSIKTQASCFFTVLEIVVSNDIATTFSFKSYLSRASVTAFLCDNSAPFGNSATFRS